jgi:hypothetical protein
MFRNGSALLKSCLIAGLDVSAGPSHEYPQFQETMWEAYKLLKFDSLLADKGFDVEPNHVHARKRLGIKSTVIALKKNRNGTNRARIRMSDPRTVTEC